MAGTTTRNIYYLIGILGSYFICIYVYIAQNNRTEIRHSIFIYNSSCVHTAEITPFIWSDIEYTWYNVTSSNVNSSLNMSVGTVILDTEIIQFLSQNVSDQSYRRFGQLLEQRDNEQIKQWLEGGGQPKYESRIARFHEVLVSNEGWIVDKTKCTAVRNGGCPTLRSWSPIKTPVKHFDTVISIAAMWSHGIWHFPMESLVSLSNMQIEDEHYIHVESKSQWVMQWLNISRISSKRVISGTVATRLLIIPEMGKCGTPSLYQINWMRSLVVTNDMQNPRSILLIKRTNKRIVMNFDKIEEKVKYFSKQHGYEFTLHDDRSLPPLQFQLERFQKAAMVVGPHGAGLVNLIASKAKTCVIEFLETSYINLCYTRLSYLLGHNYFGISMHSNKVDPRNVVEKLYLCHMMKDR